MVRGGDFELGIWLFSIHVRSGSRLYLQEWNRRYFALHFKRLGIHWRVLLFRSDVAAGSDSGSARISDAALLSFDYLFLHCLFNSDTSDWNGSGTLYFRDFHFCGGGTRFGDLFGIRDRNVGRANDHVGGRCSDDRLQCHWRPLGGGARGGHLFGVTTYITNLSPLFGQRRGNVWVNQTGSRRIAARIPHSTWRPREPDFPDLVYFPYVSRLQCGLASGAALQQRADRTRREKDGDALRMVRAAGSPALDIARDGG